jgi:predicted RNase H-like HicB family nuclease
MKFLVVYEDGGSNYSAYVPDLPGCVSTGATREEVVRNIREAITGHLRAMRADGDPLPTPVETWAEVVEVTLDEAPSSTAASASAI